jgi:hypothetical protein
MMNTLTTPAVRHSAAPRRRASLGRRLAAAFAVAATGALVALGAAVPANAATGVQVTANPTSIAVGATTTITATGLGGLEKAGFGLDDNSAGTFTQSKSSDYEAPVKNGTATATFSAAKAGTVTVSVGDGENVLGTVKVTISGSAPATVQVQASPASIETGATATITVTGLSGLSQASFGLGDNAAGTFTENGGTTYEAPVTNGTATATFKAAQSGDVTIAVGDGETVLGTTSISVTAAPSPTPTTTPTPTPAPAPAGLSTAGLIGIIIGVVVLIAAAAVIGALVARSRAKRKLAEGEQGDQGTPTV